MSELDPTPVEQPDEGTVLKTGKPKVANCGRKRADIDLDQLVKLAEIGCSTDEMGDFFGVDGSTIRRKYTAVLKQVKAKTKARVRQAQLDSALNGDRTMLIWLGKQMLSQSDTGERNDDNNKPLPFLDD